MRLLHPISRRRQPLRDLMRDHHAAVMASGAPERNRQVALALLDVVRQKIYQQSRDPLDEFLGLRKTADITRHAGILSAELLESRNVIRVGQEANVKHQVAFARDAVTETEAVYLDENLARVAMKSRAYGL